MKKFSLLVLSMLVLTMAGCGNEIITYTKPYRLEGSATKDGARGGIMMTRAFVARSTYYTIDPRDTGYPLYVRMVDANGLDLPNPAWHPLDPEYAEYDEAILGPNLRIVQPKKPGSTTISAEQDGFVATARIEILPVLYARVPGAGVSPRENAVDIDGDGIADFVRAEEWQCKFPFGAYVMDLWGHPYNFSDIAADTPAPESSDELIITPVELPASPFFAICYASGGGVYAAWVSNETLRSAIASIKLR